jgi:hypothetical protein
MSFFRDVIIFLAGAEAFHTITHILLPFAVVLPLTTKYLVVTPEINYGAIVVNGVITILLLWWAAKLKR